MEWVFVKKFLDHIKFYNKTTHLTKICTKPLYLTKYNTENVYINLILVCLKLKEYIGDKYFLNKFSNMLLDYIDYSYNSSNLLIYISKIVEIYYIRPSIHSLCMINSTPLLADINYQMIINRFSESEKSYKKLNNLIYILEIILHVYRTNKQFQKLYLDHIIYNLICIVFDINQLPINIQNNIFIKLNDLLIDIIEFYKINTLSIRLDEKYIELFNYKLIDELFIKLNFKYNNNTKNLLLSDIKNIQLIIFTRYVFYNLCLLY